MKKNRCCLVILDGWGKGSQDETDAVFSAQTPFVDSLYENFAHAELRTDGEHVGLPDGQMGNSEVGHMNIGAGRIVYQDLLKINKAVESGEFSQNEVLKRAFIHCKESGRKLHFMGLLGDGGVHASQEHLYALIRMAESYGIEKYFIHGFTDGRDTDPKSALEFVGNLESFLSNKKGSIATLIGRYFAMDRDKRWERISKAYELLVRGKGIETGNVCEAIRKSYTSDISDEFLEPHVVVDSEGDPLARIDSGDVLICFNFRTDRCREITQVLTQKEFPKYKMSPLQLEYYTLTNYDHSFKNVVVIYDKENISMTLGEVVSQAGLSQLRIAETEKYPHVSFFFSGGREEVFPQESRIMVNSPKVATYDLQPEMSAMEVKNEVINSMRNSTPNFICLNFANPDMVGHTGVFSAIVKACETVDKCLSEVVAVAQEMGYSLVVLADHGNADFAVNPDGSPNTAHSLNPVPVFVIDEDVKKLEDGVLANVAPTVLKLMRVTVPKEMTHAPLF